MAVKILERERLKSAIGREESVVEISRVLEMQRSTEHVEIGGEACLAGSPETLLLIDIPHKFGYFSRFLTELSQGNYVDSHFRELYDFLTKDIELSRVDRRISKTLLRKMEAFQNNGQIPEEAKKIGKDYRDILSRTYYPESHRTRKMYGSYVGDFHVHYNGERPSADDLELARGRPEIVIINNTERIDEEFNRSVGLVYMYKEGGYGAASGHPRKVRRFNFGPYPVRGLKVF